MAEVLVVALFGGLGALLRSTLAKFNGYLPWGILIANTFATAVAAWALLAAPQLGLVLVAGLAGGLSTFSTFVAQTWQLLTDGKLLAAGLNIILNLIVPSTAVMLVVVCL
jgi:CrcB protein